MIALLSAGLLDALDEGLTRRRQTELDRLRLSQRTLAGGHAFDVAPAGRVAVRARRFSAEERATGARARIRNDLRELAHRRELDRIGGAARAALDLRGAKSLGVERSE